ncbi:DNA-directed RNA polymerase subunit delta [Candidatus Phytoplasma sacchari]|uniref:RNAP delta factor n=1 Tax=Candidatus Phytoplasma sacchari TaxID=2609813 RepID=A0ABY7M3V7_9MOLU|nr:DNA-directed RNA polymerase subunit delta [Candidatus Phytoplasma sacchari]
MKKDEKSNFEKSMLDLSYEILKKNKKPMSIYKLMEKVFILKKMDFNNKDIVSQLYLDIVLSGNFVFHGNSFWSVKEGNLNLWDQEYFSNVKNEKNDFIKQEDSVEIEKKIFNFNDFILNKNETEYNVGEEKYNDSSEEEVYSDLDFENNEIGKKLSFEDEEINEREDDINNIEDYEYLENEK